MKIDPFTIAYKKFFLFVAASILISGCATGKYDQKYRESNLSQKPFGANVLRAATDGSLVELEVRNNTERRIDFVTVYFYPYNGSVRVGEGLWNIQSFNPGETLIITVPVMNSGRKWDKWKVDFKVLR